LRSFRIVPAVVQFCRILASRARAFSSGTERKWARSSTSVASSAAHRACIAFACCLIGFWRISDSDPSEAPSIEVLVESSGWSETAWSCVFSCNDDGSAPYLCLGMVLLGTSFCVNETFSRRKQIGNGGHIHR